jgi:hypothetical protein
MVSQLMAAIWPVNVMIRFEDRPYTLGEAVQVTVELNTRRDVGIREGRLELICEERFTDVITVMTPEGGARGARLQMDPRGRQAPLPIARVPRQVVKKRREAYVRSSMVFLTNDRVRSGMTRTFSAQLAVGEERPAHAEKAELRWRLEVALNIVAGRDVERTWPVQVTLGPAS